MTPEERRQALEQIEQEAARCTRCRLHESRTNAVPGEGHAETEVIFVGEGPGFNEDQQGRPFVGAAGGLLNELLKSIGWSREEVYITNVVKCRPPGNRDPQPDEIAACRPYLRRQLEVLDPAVLVTLGRISTGTLLPGARIAASHGTVRPLDQETGAPDAIAYPMYHPAAAFRQPGLKETLQADFAGLPDALIASRRRRAAGPAPTRGDDASESVGVTMAAEPVAVPVEPAPAPVQSAVPSPEPASVPVESAVPSTDWSVPGEGSGLRALDVEISVPLPADGDERPDPNQLSLF